MLIITHQSHLDHAIPTAALALALRRFADRSAFFLETIDLAVDLPGVELVSALRGPTAGDEPITRPRGYEIAYRRRGQREGTTRMVTNLGPKPTTLLTVIAGPADGGSCVLYTAHGGPPAAREPWEVHGKICDAQARGEDTAALAAELQASQQFWALHALAASR